MSTYRAPSFVPLPRALDHGRLTSFPEGLNAFVHQATTTTTTTTAAATTTTTAATTAATASQPLRDVEPSAAPNTALQPPPRAKLDEALRAAESLLSPHETAGAFATTR